MNAGSSLYFEVEGITTPLAAGEAFFQIRTAQLNVSLNHDGSTLSITDQPNWVFLDRAVATVNIQAAQLEALSIEIETAIEFGVGEDLKYTFTSIPTFEMRTGMVADLHVKFKTVNVIRHGSTIVMLFGEGFNVAGASIDLSQIPGHATVSPPTDVLTINWLNQTSIPPGTNISFVMKNITFPSNRQGERPHLDIQTFSELGKLVHENLDVYALDLSVGRLRHLQATVIPTAAHPLVRLNQTIILNVSFAFSSRFYPGSILSIQFRSNTFKVDQSYVPDAVCLRTETGSNLRYISKVAQCGSSNTGPESSATSQGPGAYLEIPYYNYTAGTPKGQMINVLNATGGREMKTGEFFWILLAGIVPAKSSKFPDELESAEIVTYNISKSIGNMIRVLDNSSVVLKSYTLSVRNAATDSDPFDITQSDIISLKPLIVSNLIAFPWVDGNRCPSNISKVKFMWKATPLSNVDITVNEVLKNADQPKNGYYHFITGCATMYEKVGNDEILGSIDNGANIARPTFIQLPSVPLHVSISVANHGVIQLDWVNNNEDQIVRYELQVSGDFQTKEQWTGTQSDWPELAIRWGPGTGRLDNIIKPCCSGGKSCCGLSTLLYTNTEYLSSGRQIYARLRKVGPVSLLALGQWSDVKEIVVIGQPSSPYLVFREHTSPSTQATGVLLSWHSPTDMGLGNRVPGIKSALLINFDLQMKNMDVSGPWITVALTAPNITDHFEALVEGVVYSFRVRGNNLLGPGKWSTVISLRASARPSGVPAIRQSVVSGSDATMRISFDAPSDTGHGNQNASLTSVLVEQYRDSSFRPCCTDDRYSLDCGSVSNHSESMHLESSIRLSSIASTATVTCSGCDCVPSSGQRQGSIHGIVSKFSSSNATVCTWLISADSDISLQFSLVNLTSVGAERVQVFSCALSDCGTSSNSSRILLALLDSQNTVHGQTNPPLAYSSSTDFLQIVFNSNGQLSSRDTTFFQATWTLAEARLIQKAENNGNLVYVFDVDGVERSIAYRFRVQVANKLAYGTNWSPVSDAVQAQNLPIPDPSFISGEQGVTFGNLSYELHWNISSSWSGPQDFTYRIRKYFNPQYPLVGSINAQPHKTVEALNATATVDFNTITADGFASFQHVRSWGAVDLEFFAAGGLDFLALASGKQLAYASNRAPRTERGSDEVRFGYFDPENDKTSEAIQNWGYVGKDSEVLTLYARNTSTGVFGGACEYKPSVASRVDTPCSLTETFCDLYQDMYTIAQQQHCSSYFDPPSRMYQYTGQNFVFMPSDALTKLNVHQTISTYGASAVRIFSTNGEIYMMVANTRVPHNFMCVETDTEFPYRTDRLLGGSYAEWKLVKQCNHWSDTITCASTGYSTRCVGHPAGSVSANTSTLFSTAHSVLYRFNPADSEFYMHQVVPANDPTALTAFVSNNSNVTMPILAIAQGSGGVQIFSLGRSSAGCGGYSMTSESLGTYECLHHAQTLSSRSASAVILFDVLNQPKYWSRGKNETLLIIAHTAIINTSDPSELHPMGQGSLYTWVNGSFVEHPTLFRALPTDGAVCLENSNVYGRHIIIICQSSACRSDRAGGPIAVADEDIEYVAADGRCSVVYEWRNSSLILLQVLPVSTAQSVTAFTRRSTRKGVENDHYLLVAGNGSLGGEPQSESVLMRWETSLSSTSLLLFQGYARVRKIYTRKPRRWAVLTSGFQQFAAVATAGHFQGTSVNPTPQLPEECANTACLKARTIETPTTPSNGILIFVCLICFILLLLTCEQYCFLILVSKC